MPLVLLCGLPASGKTTRARQLADHLAAEYPDRPVTIIGDDSAASASASAGKNSVYANPTAEKEARASLKSEAERLLAGSPAAVVIVDSLNYIKGYRYELYCSAKHLRHTQCLVFCDVAQSLARSWNDQRSLQDKDDSSISQSYQPDLFDQLCARFEPPSAANRWDSPLVLVPNDEPLDCGSVCRAVFDRRPDKPNQSTQARPQAGPDFLHDIDQATRRVMQQLVAAQASALPGDQLAVPGCQRRLVYSRPVSLGELQRCRKQFLTGLRSRPSDGASVAGATELFVEYLNSTL